MQEMTKPYPSPRFLLDVVVKSRNSVGKVGLSGIMYVQESREGQSYWRSRFSSQNIIFGWKNKNAKSYCFSGPSVWNIPKNQLFAYVSGAPNVNFRKISVRKTI